MDWNNYLSFAETLVVTNNQAAIRSAMSRAYYGVFNIVRASDPEFMDYNEKIHSHLIKHFKNSGDSTSQKIGIILKTLRDERNRADYDSNDSISQSQVRTHIGSAKHVIKLLNTLKSTAKNK